MVKNATEELSFAPPRRTPQLLRSSFGRHDHVSAMKELRYPELKAITTGYQGGGLHGISSHILADRFFYPTATGGKSTSNPFGSWRT